MIENRQGVVLNDPMLSMFNPINLTWFIFALLYIGIIIAVIKLLKNTDLLSLALQAFIVMELFRTLAMLLIPLDPPIDMIGLKDPVIEIFGTGQMLTRDLFFSGHTASLFLLFLIFLKNKIKYFYLVSTILVGIALILQHVHYSIDVLSAPFFAYGSYRLVLIFKNKCYK